MSDGEHVEPEFVVVGRIGRAHGVHGEVRVEPLTDYPELRFARGSNLLIGHQGGGAPRRATVVSSRPHRSVLLVRFDIAEHREAAQALTGSEVLVAIDEVYDPGPDAFYEYELVGLEVFTIGGVRLGVVETLIETGAADVLVIASVDEAGVSREILVPLIGDVIQEIAIEHSRITIDPLPGLLGEEE